MEYYVCGFQARNFCTDLSAYKGVALSLNLHRRHLKSDQRAAVAVDMLPLLEAEAKKRQGARNDLNIPEKIPESEAESREIAAQALNTNSHYVSDMKKIKAEQPEVFEEIKRGDKRLSESQRAMVAASIADMPANTGVAANLQSLTSRSEAAEMSFLK